MPANVSKWENLCAVCGYCKAPFVGRGLVGEVASECRRYLGHGVYEHAGDDYDRHDKRDKTCLDVDSGKHI